MNIHEIKLKLPEENENILNLSSCFISSPLHIQTQTQRNTHTYTHTQTHTHKHTHTKHTHNHTDTQTFTQSSPNIKIQMFSGEFYNPLWLILHWETAN